MKPKPRYTIGELARISGISTKTLRFYDRKGLLKPSERDEKNNYRYYSEQQVVDAVMIREMKRRGFSMTEQKSLLRTSDLHRLQDALASKISDIQQEIDKFNGQMNCIRHTLSLVQEAIAVYQEEAISQTAKFDTVPDRIVLFNRKKTYINANHLFWDRYNELQKLREELQVTPVGYFSGIFYDHYFNQFFFDEGDLEVYLPIQETHMTGPNIRKIEGFQRASMVFVGWYSGLLPIYVELVKQIESSGYRIAGPAYEEYLVDFSSGVPDENCMTRIFFPVEPIK
ncbi:MAG: MerR family transcriptional regulator [Synergistaceae bacterium]|jgi:DNA-binding transcriptional MerR regulator|nr:MerR family transcriptional regulator [Synergistaceae bacterium]